MGDAGPPRGLYDRGRRPAHPGTPAGDLHPASERRRRRQAALRRRCHRRLAAVSSVVVAAGAGLVWFAPTITAVAPALVPVVRLTCALLTVSLLFGNLASLPESVLRGMNLGYKRMGLQAGLEVVGGALVAGGVSGGVGMA